ncbi:MAG: H-NS histone family protein [Azoarcus sp.]|nr:H-NS histone family protein [Azoarcus sp.]
MELSALSVQELKRLHSRIDTELKKRNDSAKRDLVKKFKKLADEQGVQLEDVMKAAGASPAPTRRRRTAGAATKKKVGGKLPIKYRNPADPSQGWSGHGRRPQWVLDWLAQGKSLDQLGKA